MDYLTLKTIHQTAVALSIAGFTARGLGSLRGADWVRRGAARTWPHLVDTVLLVSAIVLAWTAGIHPLNSPWLLAKLIALVVYIALGMAALRPSLPLALRWTAWLLALVTFAYIACVAISKTPLGILAWF